MKSWWIALVLAALPTAAVAQSAMGLRAGTRWSELETSQETQSVSGMVLAGYIGFGLSNRLGLQFEAVYGKRGGEGLGLGDNELDPSGSPVAVEMTYIDVPILLRAGIPGQRFLPTLFIGPYIGFLLDCELTPAGGSGRSCDEGGVDQRFDPRSTEIGLLAGVGLDIAFGENTLFVDGRYSLGLLSIQDRDDPFDGRHQGFAITAGMAFPLGR